VERPDGRIDLETTGCLPGSRAAIRYLNASLTLPAA